MHEFSVDYPRGDFHSNLMLRDSYPITCLYVNGTAGATYKKQK